MRFLAKTFERFGPAQIDMFSPTSFRVVYWSRRVHNGASCGTLTGHGKTPEAAAKRLLEIVDASEGVYESHCPLCAKMGDW